MKTFLLFISKFFCLSIIIFAVFSIFFVGPSEVYAFGCVESHLESIGWTLVCTDLNYGKDCTHNDEYCSLCSNDSGLTTYACRFLISSTPETCTSVYWTNQCSGGPGPGPASSFTVSIGPSLQTIYQGYSTNYTVSVTPSNYTGTVNLDHAGSCPANATCSFSPTSVAITDTSVKTSILTIVSNPSIAIQNYTITARGTDSVDSTKTSSASATLEVKVNPFASCDSQWHDIPWETFSNPYGLVYAPGNSLSAARKWDGVYLSTEWNFSGAIYEHGLQTAKCLYGYGSSICWWGTSISSEGTGDNSIYSSQVYTENPSDIYGDINKFFKDNSNNTWGKVGSYYSNLGAISKPWGTLTTVTDKDGRNWDFQIVGTYPKKAQYKCGPGTCVPRTFNPTTSGFFDTKIGGSKITSVNPGPGQTFYAKCDYGIQQGYMGVSATGVSCPRWEGWDTTGGGMAAVAGCDAPVTPGTYAFLCNISQNVADPSNSCSASNSMGSIIVNGPNLTASTPTQSSATIGTPQTFTSTISNSGTAAVGASFYNSLQVATGANGSGAVSPLTAATPSPMSALNAGGTAVASASYTFTGAAGTRSVRFCADNDTSMVGIIAESNEGDNCSGWRDVTVNAPTVSISATPSTIPYNTSSTITWSSSNTTSCGVAPDGWTGLSGSQSTGNLTASKIYTISCNPGPVSSSATVNVGAQTTNTLTVLKSGQGTVTGVSVPAQTNINCGTACVKTYTADTTVTLTAVPNTSRIFTGWTVQGGGSCARGTGPVFTCSVSLSSSKTVTANFAIDPSYREF